MGKNLLVHFANLQNDRASAHGHILQQKNGLEPLGRRSAPSAHSFV